MITRSADGYEIPQDCFIADSEIAGARDSLHEAIADHLQDSCMRTGGPETITCESGVALPGFYRPARKWPVVAHSEGTLVAAVWVDTEPWPGLAWHLNLLVAEAVSNASDLRQAYLSGRLGDFMPAVTYLLCVCDCPESRSAIPWGTQWFAIDQTFEESSYLELYHTFCRRLLSTGVYDAVCFATRERVTETGPNPPVIYPDPALTFETMAALINRRARLLPK